MGTVRFLTEPIIIVSDDEFRVPIKHPFQIKRAFFGCDEILKHMREIFFETTAGTPSPRLLDDPTSIRRLWVPSRRFGATKGRKAPKVAEYLLDRRVISRRVITLHGIGGAGKSQICAKYAQKYDKAYTSVFWITATTADEVRRTALGAVDQIISHYITNLPNHGPSNFQRVALALGLDESDESSIEDLEELRAAVEKRSAIEVLKHWLSKEFNDRWLLIIDDYSIPRDSDYNHDGILLSNDVGHVIVTTQEPGLTDQARIWIPGNIGEENGVRLLKTLGCHDEQEWDRMLVLSFSSRHPELLTRLGSCEIYAREIVSILGGFPLALRLAGARASRGSFERCAQELRDSRTSQFIFKDKDDLKKDSLGNIWELSFSKLDRNAQKMFHLLSFIGNDIPVELVNRAKDRIMRCCEAGRFI